MQSEYVEQRNGGYYVAGTRISLDSVVYSFNQGNSPEGVKEEYPLLRLAQIYGAIAFYLDHKAQIDEYLAGEQARVWGSYDSIERGKSRALGKATTRPHSRESNI